MNFQPPDPPEYGHCLNCKTSIHQDEVRGDRCIECETEAMKNRITDAEINESTLDLLGLWPSFQAQSWACKVVHALTAQTDVRAILLDVAPGGDGEGHEVHAKSVADVEAVLAKQGERLEEMERGRNALAAVVTCLKTERDALQQRLTDAEPVGTSTTMDDGSIKTVLKNGLTTIVRDGQLEKVLAPADWTVKPNHVEGAQVESSCICVDSVKFPPVNGAPAIKPAAEASGSTCNQIREESGLPTKNPCVACNNGACIDR